MELEFMNKPIDCLRQAVWEVKNEEQTQDLKLSETMPDIGRVLGSWGQVLIRGKEWRGSSVNVSGGVLVWVLYEPEDGSALQTVETWVPFALRWDFPQTKQDGFMLINCLLRGVDARSVSARKLLIRTMVCAGGEALEPVKCDLFMPGELPEDVQLLKKSYPVCIAAEAGEKAFALEDELVLPSNMPDVGKLLSCVVTPRIRESKIVAGKAVFRGTVNMHLLYLGVDGIVYTRDFDLPFSQYSELDKEYGEGVKLRVQISVTDLEPELQGDGRLRIKCGLVGQYVVYDCPLVEVVEDAYSTRRKVSVKLQTVPLLQLLEHSGWDEDVQVTMPNAGGKSVDVVMLCGHPAAGRTEDGIRLHNDGTFQMLYYDQDGKLQSGGMGWSSEQELNIDSRCRMMAMCSAEPSEQAIMGAGEASLSGRLSWEALTLTDSGFDAVCGLEIGEESLSPEDRPSLVLCRADHENLWSIAKRCGSTVEAIQKANGLEGEPENGKMLLIPL